MLDVGVDQSFKECGMKVSGEWKIKIKQAKAESMKDDETLFCLVYSCLRISAGSFYLGCQMNVLVSTVNDLQQ